MFLEYEENEVPRENPCTLRESMQTESTELNRGPSCSKARVLPTKLPCHQAQSCVMCHVCGEFKPECDHFLLKTPKRSKTKGRNVYKLSRDNVVSQALLMLDYDAWLSITQTKHLMALSAIQVSTTSNLEIDKRQLCFVLISTDSTDR